MATSGLSRATKKVSVYPTLAEEQLADIDRILSHQRGQMRGQRSSNEKEYELGAKLSIISSQLGAGGEVVFSGLSSRSLFSTSLTCQWCK